MVEHVERRQLDKRVEFEEFGYQVFEEHCRHEEEIVSEVWLPRKEFSEKSFRIRNDKVDIGFSTSTVIEESGMEQTPKSTTTKATPTRNRAKLMHRKTDPFPIREFSCNFKEIPIIKEDTTFCDDKNIQLPPETTQDETFLVSSFDLARRRLSLPVSPIQHCWNEDGRSSCRELHDNDATLNSPQKLQVGHRSLSKSGDMEKKRRQSAYTRRSSTSNNQDDIRKGLGKRRMSELPALCSLATRRRNAPHTLSVPVGLRRRGSRPSLFFEYQTNQRASVRAKHEMLATLSMTSWLNESSGKTSDVGRRKSFHNGFGVMALKKKEEKRLMVAHEILQTEKNYIKALETLNEVFVEPFENASLIPEKDMRVIFPKQLKAIRNGHTRFMEELDERLNNFKWQGVLGDILTKLCNSYHVDFMTVYAEYVSNFPKAVALINKHSRQSHKFRKFIEKCTANPRCERLNLSAFLLTPIQRLPRYVLLLRQLSKYTDPNHPDSFHIEISTDKMIAVITVLNSSIQNSTRVVRNTSRNNSRKRNKKHVFRTREILHTPEPPSSRKSSDESETSEMSGRSTPCRKNLTLDLSTPEQHSRSSDYGSLSNSEPTSEATSPCQSSGSSKNSILRGMLRTSGEGRSNRRPLSTTEVEIFRRKDENSPDNLSKVGILKRSSSRDSLGSIIRHKLGSFRKKHRSSDENLTRNSSLERLEDDDCKVTLFKGSHEHLREDSSHNAKIYNRFTLKKNKKPPSPSSASSAESFDETRELISPTHEQISPTREQFSPTRGQFAPIREQISPREPASPVHEQQSPAREQLSPSCDTNAPARERFAREASEPNSPCHSIRSTCGDEIRFPSREHISEPREQNEYDSPCTSPSPSRPISRTEDEWVEKSDEIGRRRSCSETVMTHNERQSKRERKKITKRNSISDVMKQFFVSKTRSHSPEVLDYNHSPSEKRKHIFNSSSSKEKITTV